MPEMGSFLKGKLLLLRALRIIGCFPFKFNDSVTTFKIEVCSTVMVLTVAKYSLIFIPALGLQILRRMDAEGTGPGLFKGILW